MRPTVAGAHFVAVESTGDISPNLPNPVYVDNIRGEL